VIGKRARRPAPWGVRIAAGVVLLIGALAAILVVVVLVLEFVPRATERIDLDVNVWLAVGFGTFAAVSGLGTGIGILRGNRPAYLTLLGQSGVGLAVTLTRATREGFDTGTAIAVGIAATLLAALTLPPRSRAFFREEDTGRPADARPDPRPGLEPPPWRATSSRPDKFRKVGE